MFSIGQIVVSALVGALLSVALALVHARWSKNPIVPWGQGITVAVVVGLSILFWRLAGNVAPLNDDPMPLVSPNDVLCPAITYVFLGVYAGLRGSLTSQTGPPYARL